MKRTCPKNCWCDCHDAKSSMGRLRIDDTKRLDRLLMVLNAHSRIISIYGDGGWFSRRSIDKSIRASRAKR